MRRPVGEQRWAAPAAAADSVLLVVVAAAAGLALLRRTTRPAGAADLVVAEGMHAGQVQPVCFEGGPLDGSRLPLPWSARSYEMALDDHSQHRYVDSGRTAATPTGEPARVFVARRVTPA